MSAKKEAKPEALLRISKIRFNILTLIFGVLALPNSSYARLDEYGYLDYKNKPNPAVYNAEFVPPSRKKPEPLTGSASTNARANGPALKHAPVQENNASPLVITTSHANPVSDIRGRGGPASGGTQNNNPSNTEVAYPVPVPGPGGIIQVNVSLEDYNGPLKLFEGKCVVWVAAIMQQVLGRAPFSMRDAQYWDDDALAAGYFVSSRPTVGAVAVWGPAQNGGIGNVGHVAFVEEVRPDGSIVVSEANLDGKNSIGERVVTDFSGVNFVQLIDLDKRPERFVISATDGT